MNNRIIWAGTSNIDEIDVDFDAFLHVMRIIKKKNRYRLISILVFYIIINNLD